MLPTEDLFVYTYVLVDDAICSGAIVIAARPGPAPACTDAELLAVALVRHLLGRRSEAGFLAEVARDWAHLFPRLPHQSEANRRIRWPWGAFEQVRAMVAAQVPDDDCQQVDTSAIPVKHTSRVRGPDQWTGPGNDLAARFGRDAAHAEWFYGFRLAIKTDLGSRIMRACSIVPTAVNEREVAIDLLCAGRLPRDLLADKGFNGKDFAAQLAAQGTAVLIPPGKDQRATMPPLLLKVIAEWRNRVETAFAEITDQMELARHGAHTFWGVLTRTAATIAAHTILRARRQPGACPCPATPGTNGAAGQAAIEPQRLDGCRRGRVIDPHDPAMVMTVIPSSWTASAASSVHPGYRRISALSIAVMVRLPGSGVPGSKERTSAGVPRTATTPGASRAGSVSTVSPASRSPSTTC